MNVHVKKYSLCESRHQTPSDCTQSIFSHTVDLGNFAALEDIADKVVCQCKCDGCIMHVYVTGVQAPLVAVINSANKRKLKLVLWHWNPVIKEYIPQNVYQEDNDEQ